MKRNEVIDFMNPVLPIIHYLLDRTQIQAGLTGVMTFNGKEDSDFIEVSLLSFDRDTHLSRIGDYMVRAYTPISKGLTHSFDTGKKVQDALELMCFSVDTIQVSNVSSGSILTDSDYPTHYAQEMNLETLSVRA